MAHTGDTQRYAPGEGGRALPVRGGRRARRKAEKEERRRLAEEEAGRLTAAHDVDPRLGRAAAPPAAPPQQVVAADPERVLVRLRPHGRALTLPVLLLLAICLAGGYFGSWFPEPWENALLLVSLAGVAVFVTLLPVLVWLNRRYTVTTRRLIVSHGFFVRTRQELLHSRGYDVTLRRGPLQHLHRSGHVSINAGLESPVVLRDVPSAVLVVQALQDLMEENANMVAERRRQEESRRGRPGDPARRQQDEPRSVWPDDTQPWQRG